MPKTRKPAESPIRTLTSASTSHRALSARVADRRQGESGLTACHEVAVVQALDEHVQGIGEPASEGLQQDGDRPWIVDLHDPPQGSLAYHRIAALVEADPVRQAVGGP